MDMRSVVVATVFLVLICFSGVWAARLIQEDETLPPIKNQQTTPSTVQKKQTQVSKDRQPRKPVTAAPQKAQPGMSQPQDSSQTPPPDLSQADGSNQGNRPQVRQPRRPAGQNDTTSGGTGQSGQFITMDFDGVDIKVFIKFIADITGKNFIIDDKVTGKVTVISPRKMTLDEAYKVFLSVLDVNGFGTVGMGEGVFKVVRAADAMTKSLETTVEPPVRRDDSMVTQIIPLKYADSNDMRNLLTPLMSKGASQILAYPQSNVLIVTDTKANVRKIIDILKVVDVAGFAQEVRIFPLTYATAADLSQKLSDIIAEGRDEEARRLRNVRQQDAAGTRTSTRIIPYERTNSLIVLAPSPDLPAIGELIEKLDIPTPTGKEDIHVYYLQHAKAEDLAKVLTEIPTPEGQEAPVLQAGQQQSGQAARTRTMPNTSLKEKNIKISPDKETNALIIYADPNAYKSLVETIKFLDIPRKQVYVSALIMEVDSTKDFKVGVEWSFFDDFKYDGQSKTGGVFGRTGQNFTTTSNLPTGALLGVVGQSITISQGSTEITFPNMTAFINAMVTNSDVNVISTPQILTMDNKEAEIKVGRNVPYLTRSETDLTNLNNTVRTYDYRDVGVTLKLTPQINQQGNIRMAIFEETTTLVEGTGDEEFAPTTLKRSANTTVSIKDGNTMVIGGLIGDTLSITGSKVPLLGDIPILGHLFKSFNRSRNKTNLYIFITPYIIDTEQQAQTLYEKKKKEAEEDEKPFDKVREK
jgi:general secretion pathway protein D